MLIVGSGFAGLGAAIRLDRAGMRDFLVIERGSEVGGTWRDNAYPGAACDVPSQLYSFSFALNPDWSREYPPQPEILTYVRRTADESGTLDRHLFDCDMRSARWDPDSCRWLVRTTRGAFTADVLVTAFGGLSEPRMPALPGIERFRGQLFHTARWDRDIDLTGKRVAVIGTGASAIQVIPEIASIVGHLDVFQRTAPWILPRSNHRFTARQQTAFRRIPGYQRLRRGLIFARFEATTLGFCYFPRLLDVAARQGSALLQDQIVDPVLRERLTPRFQLGCKRILFSTTYYPALARENVALVTEAIEAVTDDAIVTSDGQRHQVDVIVVATGFRATDSPAADLITGADGRTLAEQWRTSGQEAYKGTTVAGFPNLFSLVGPNTGTGNMSLIYMIESQLNYLLDALRAMDRHRLATVEVRRSAQDSFNRTVQRRMRRTVWTTGCASWYLDRRGRNTSLWPGFALAFRALTRRFDLHAYRSTPRPDADLRSTRRQEPSLVGSRSAS